jgi:hypothetical protein
VPKNEDGDVRNLSVFAGFSCILLHSKARKYGTSKSLCHYARKGGNSKTALSKEDKPSFLESAGSIF